MHFTMSRTQHQKQVDFYRNTLEEERRAVTLACRSEASRGDRITQRLDTHREGKHRTILEETDSREEGGTTSREHIEGRLTRCMEEKRGWIDLRCDMGRKLTLLDRFLC
jgi:hypothetical protein